MDIQSILAAQGYKRQVAAVEPDAAAQGRSQIETSLNDFKATLQETENLAMDAMVSDADPHMLVQALAQSELAVETVVTVRDKVVEAYQEILRMPI